MIPSTNSVKKSWMKKTFLPWFPTSPLKQFTNVGHYKCSLIFDSVCLSGTLYNIVEYSFTIWPVIISEGADFMVWAVDKHWSLPLLLCDLWVSLYWHPQLYILPLMDIHRQIFIHQMWQLGGHNNVRFICDERQIFISLLEYSFTSLEYYCICSLGYRDLL